MPNLSGIFEQLNKLNLQMQSQSTNVIKFVDILKAVKAKLQSWKKKIKVCNFAMFQKVDMLLDSRENKILEKLRNILKHLSALRNESRDTFQRQLMKTWIL